MGVCFICSHKGCLSVLPYNFIGHNENVMSAWRVFATSYIRHEIKFMTLYKYELLSI